MTTPSYDTDFYAWTQAQAQVLRAKDVAALDLEHLAEEIESLGKPRPHAPVHGHLKRPVDPPLEVGQLSPHVAAPSWRRSIHNARDTLRLVLDRQTA